MPSCRSSHAFTLVEVVGALAAFTIAFLAGSAAFARLLQQQTVNYHRSLGAAAAMLLTDWHCDAGDGDDFLANTAYAPADVVGSPPIRPLQRLAGPGQARFRGSDWSAGDSVCVFLDQAKDGPDEALDLRLYRGLIVTVSRPGQPEADSRMRWRQLTFWYGDRQAVRDGKRVSLEYVGRYLVPDQWGP